MATINPVKLGIPKKLRDPEYRRAFFKLNAQARIPDQIRALMEKRDLTQAALGDKCGMKRSAVSRILSDVYSGWNFTTLQRVADALDAELRVSFIPAEEVITDYERSEQSGEPIVGTTQTVVVGVGAAKGTSTAFAVSAARTVFAAATSPAGAVLMHVDALGKPVRMSPQGLQAFLEEQGVLLQETPQLIVPVASQVTPEIAQNIIQENRND